MVGVLLVEDDPAIRSTLARALRDRGHAVDAVGTAADAMAALASRPPDLVVLDLGLPDIDGSNVLRVARALSGVPVIVATARDDDIEIVRLLDAGADDYLVKLFSAEDGTDTGVQFQGALRGVRLRLGVVG